MTAINKMYIENLANSLLLKAGLAQPCGLQFGDIPEWHSWFPNVDQINAGVSKKPNTSNLPVWLDGRGPFVDSFLFQNNGLFVDFKGHSKKPNLNGKKLEVWAGSPIAGERRSDGILHSKEEVVSLFLKNQNQHQIIQSFKNLDKPYLLGILWPEVNADGQIVPMQIQVNVSKMWAAADKGRGKLEHVGFMVRAKEQLIDGIYPSICARVEVKFFNSNALEYLISIGASQGVVPIDADWKPLL